MSIFKRFWADCSGATAIEYGMIAAGVAAAIAATVTALGGGLTNTYTSVENKLG